VCLLASDRILPAKTPATQALLNQKRQRIDEELRPCRGDYSWKDEPRAKDVLRTYVCDIYDCLKEAYSYKVSIWEWEKEIAAEAVSITLGCWNKYKLGTHHLLLVEPLRNTITQHVGHELRSGPIQHALIKPATLETYAAAGLDIDSKSPLLQAAMSHGAQQVFVPTPSQIVAPQPAKISRSITSPSAARKLEQFISTSGLTLTQFAGKAEADQRTIRRFRRTGTVDKTVLARIAGVMNTSVEKLLK